MDGILNVLKPPGMTSHDVVDVVRRLAGLRRVGHTGTLDPGAAGVLVVCLGRATRLSEFLMDADKEYRVELRLGTRTSTGDAYGEVLPDAGPAGLRPPGLAGVPDARTARSPGPSKALGRTAVEAVLRRFVGDILQVPPMVSAIHHEGTRLYRLARRGEVVDLQPRRVVVRRIEILRADRDWRRLLLQISCGKGTYIRKLCADIGDALGPGGYAHFMVRMRSGVFGIAEAWTLEELGALAAQEALVQALVTMDQAVGHLPAVELPDRSIADVLHGHPVPVWKLGEPVPDDTPVRLRSRRGTLVALAKVEQGVLRPFKVLGATPAGPGGPRPSRPRGGPTGGGPVAHRVRPR